MTGISMVKQPTWQGKSGIPQVPRRHIMMPMSKSFPSALNVPGEGWDPARGWDDGQGGGGYVDMNPQNSYWEWELGLLKAGTWTIALYAVGDPSRGIASFSVNGTIVATIDLYAAANDYPGVKRTTTFVLASDRDVTFRISNPTKNAASTGYQVTARILTLDRTGA